MRLIADVIEVPLLEPGYVNEVLPFPASVPCSKTDRVDTKLCTDKFSLGMCGLFLEALSLELRCLYF
jgi:hypothetical protein